MIGLRIRLFGCPAVSRDGGGWLRQTTRSADRLLGYLALNGERPHAREKLAELLWEDAPPERARNALKTTLWRLRQSLEPCEADRGRFLKIGRAGEIGLNFSSDLWCDAHEFVFALHGPDPGKLRDSVLAVEGELLEGFYDDWIIAERERLDNARFGALLQLMTMSTEAGAYEEALNYGRRILDRDPLRESVHRRMIRLHLRLGQRTQALRQYDSCITAIRNELGLEPMPETRALYAQIRALDCVAVPPGDAAQEIRRAMDRVEDAIRQLSRSHDELASQLAAIDKAAPTR